MMKRVIELFKEITLIPHCSWHTEQLRDYLIDFAKKHHASVEQDQAGNILVTIGTPVICMQAHYDMVCVGEYESIEIEEENGYLKAKNSSLGADDGIGVAMMLHFIERQTVGEYLFTNNEEVGLIGVENMSLTPQSNYILNLDGEDDGHVMIGCSGGVLLSASQQLSYEEIKGEREFYRVVTTNLLGGHSGVDISKEIPNAIKEVVDFLANNEIDLIELNGGERFNAIPTNATAIFGRVPGVKLSNDSSHLKFEKLDQKFTQKIKNQDQIIHGINGFVSGVWDWNPQYQIPKTSINLGKVQQEGNALKLDLLGRSSERREQRRLISQVSSYFKMINFDLDIREIFWPWEEEEKLFAKEILKLGEGIYSHPKFVIVHGSTEPLVFKERFPHIEAVSIGPTIYFPHSNRECVPIKSIEKAVHWVERIVKHFNQ